MIPKLLGLAVQAALIHVRAFSAPVDLGVIGIVEQAGKVVLVRHSYKPGWMLPGGAVRRGEPPAEAIIREMREEIGLSQSAAPQLVGVFQRRMGFVSNLVCLFRVRDAVFAFKPGFEVRAVCLADPADLPDGTSPAARRRLNEMTGESAQSPYW